MVVLHCILLQRNVILLVWNIYLLSTPGIGLNVSVLIVHVYESGKELSSNATYGVALIIRPVHVVWGTLARGRGCGTLTLSRTTAMTYQATILLHDLPAHHTLTWPTRPPHTSIVMPTGHFVLVKMIY